jgi:integrase
LSKSKHPPTRLTDVKIRALRADPAGEYLQGDLLAPGLSVRVRPCGIPTFIVARRLPGATNATRVTLGKVTEVSLAEARSRAAEIGATIRRGTDVNAEKRRARAKAVADRQRGRAVEVETGYLPDTFGEFAVRYIAQQTPLLRRGANVASVIRRILLPAWGERPLADLRRRDLAAIIDEILARGHPQAAHKVREVALRILNIAVDRGDVEVNFLSSPSRGRYRAGILRRVKRSRVLTDHEIRAVWDGCEQLGYPAGTVGKLLLFLGQRRGEVAGMEWGELDLGQALWVIPPHRYKTGVMHEVPLPPGVVELLRAVPRVDTRFVFSYRHGTHFAGFAKTKKRLDAICGVSGWTWHDLRRTMRSKLSELGIEADIGERVLGHVIGGTRGIYDRHPFLEEKREALARWGVHLAGIVDPSPDRVVRLRAR